MLDAVLLHQICYEYMKRSLAMFKVWFLNMACAFIHVHSIVIACIMPGNQNMLWLEDSFKTLHYHRGSYHAE